MTRLWGNLMSASCLALALFFCLSPLESQAQLFERPGGGSKFQGSVSRGFSNVGGGPGGGPGGRMLETLGLNDQQRTQFQKVQQDAQAQAKPIRQDLNRKRQELMQYIASPQANEQQALLLQKSMLDRQAKLGELRIKTWFQMRQFMSPEQLEKLKQLKGPGMRQRRQGNIGPRGEERFSPGNESGRL